MKTILNRFAIVTLLTGAQYAFGQSGTHPLPPPVIVMKGVSQPLPPPSTAKAKASIHTFGEQTAPIARALDSTGFTRPVNMKLLVLAADAGEVGYQAITTYLDEIGVPYTAVVIDSLTKDSAGNYLTNLPLEDSAKTTGLYNGFIYTSGGLSVCITSCTTPPTAADFSLLSAYISKYNIRVVTYYTYPVTQWGLTAVGNGASYTAAAALQAKLTSAGAAIFPYLNAANPIPVSGSGTGGIYAYEATATAATGETTTPILTAPDGNVLGVTHVNAAGQESLSLTFDNYPTLLHSLAFNYGLINWVSKGFFIGQRQIYLNTQTDDILFGDRLYAPNLPQCPNDPSCPDIIGTGADVDGLAAWQANQQKDKQTPYIKTAYAFVGLGASPGFAPIPDTVPPEMTKHANDFGWVNHTYTHGSIDCYTTSAAGVCQPETLSQALFEIQQNNVFGLSLSLPNDTTGLVTPFNGGLDDLAFFQAAAEEGVTSVIGLTIPTAPNTGTPSLVPSILLVPRPVTNLFYDVDVPTPGVPGSLVDEYNSLYGPAGKTPLFAMNQSYDKIIDNESTMLLQLRLLNYQTYPIAFHNSNAVNYNGTPFKSLMTDLFDATITKYEELFTLPIYSLSTMRDMSALLRDRASYNASGVTGVYTPGVGVTLKTTNAAVIPVTGFCSQRNCPLYGKDIQDRIPMAANSSLTIPFATPPGAGVGLANVSVNPTTVNTQTSSVGYVELNGIATSPVTVNLFSDSSIARVPASVTVYTGDLGATFPVATSGSGSALISATYNNVTRNTGIAVQSATALTSITAPSSAAAGTSPVARVTLSGAAPSGGITVSLISNNTAATVPANVTVPAGSTSATFPVGTLAVGSPVTGNIVAVYNGVNLTAPLTVTPGIALAVSSVSLSPVGLTTAGGVSTGTVTLNGLAPTAGALVTLSSNNPSVTVPANTTVNYGSQTATFAITAAKVAANTTATIIATYGGGTGTATLILAQPGFYLVPSAVTGGGQSSGVVVLSAAAPTGGTVVNLSSNSGTATVPATVTVAAGTSVASFPITTSAVTSPTSATITAGGGTATLTINPVAAPVTLSGVSLNPASVTGGTSSTGTVTLSGAAPAGGVTVALSSNIASATVPQSVTVAAGATTANFTVNTTAITVAASATIGASYSGTTKTASLTVNPAPVVVTLTGVSLNPASAVPGGSTTGTVTLSAAAPAGGISVGLYTNYGTVTVPTSVTVAAGVKTATFTVNVAASQQSSINATISATYNGVTVTTPITVTAAVLTGVSVSPTAASAGTGSTGTVTISQAAPTGGIVIGLYTNYGTVTVPATVTVAAGKTSGTFAIGTGSVPSATNVTVSANYAGVVKTATLTVNPGVTIANLTLNPASVFAGFFSTGTVTLTGPAPAGGAVVTFKCSDSSAQTPAQVTVPAGATSANFLITTQITLQLGFPGFNTVNDTITATYQGVSKSAVLAVENFVL